VYVREQTIEFNNKRESSIDDAFPAMDGNKRIGIVDGTVFDGADEDNDVRSVCEDFRA
jgi:hypothetical protein